MAEKTGYKVLAQQLSAGEPTVRDSLSLIHICDEVPPVPIPNTEVKRIGAEDTGLEAARENRLMPVQFAVPIWGPQTHITP